MDGQTNPTTETATESGSGHQIVLGHEQVRLINETVLNIYNLVDDEAGNIEDGMKYGRKKLIVLASMIFLITVVLCVLLDLSAWQTVIISISYLISFILIAIFLPVLTALDRYKALMKKTSGIIVNHLMPISSDPTTGQQTFNFEAMRKLIEDNQTSGDDESEMIGHG